MKDVDKDALHSPAHGADPSPSLTPACPVAVQVSGEVTNKHLNLVGVEQGTGKGGISTDLAKEPSMSSPRLLPVPDSPPPSVQLPPANPAEDT